jgi:CTP:molybdopterin cytidylyltransferase MocA
MGRIKQLLLLPDRPAIRRCLESLFAGGVAGVIVVLAPDSPVAAAVRDLPVKILCNEDPASDMAGSVRVGLQATDPAVRSVLVSLADHPLVTPGTIAAILAEGAASPGSIIIPTYRGRRGHPTLFPRSIIDTILSVGTLRDVIADNRGAVRRLDVDDEGVVLDMDTEQDYQELLRRTGAAS